LSETQKKLKVEGKLYSASKILKRNLEASYGVPITQKQSTVENTDNINTQQRHLNKVMHELKEAFMNTTSYKRKLQILTVSPYTIKETQMIFETTRYMVKKSRKIKKKHGILPEVPAMSKGKVISEPEKRRVARFYESDEVSRMCPGKKECLNVRDAGGQVIAMQKRLVLGNLREIFALYQKDLSNPNIGFSAFANLRPRYCVLAGSGGTHCVCVCTYHQNPKLQLAALGEKDLTYKDLMDYSVCSTEREECMMLICKDCPREEGVLAFLELLDSVQEAPDVIVYKQWVTVDRCTMIDKVEPLDEYLSSLSAQVSRMVRHHYVTQKQSQFFKDLKETLPLDQAIVVGDFSENYSFIVQDAVQGFHWENSQCTVHPFICYYKSNNSQDHCHSSFCFLSDSLQHNTVMVHCFISNLVNYLKIHLPHLNKIHYFSDGCAGQYKNKYNFINLCHHKEDFGLDCEWHFFSTSHGKTACDGIGGTVKRATARASLQRTTFRQILTPEAMFTFCEEKLSTNITFFWVSKVEVAQSEERLKDRFASSQVIPGTRKYHRFIPINKDVMHVYTISSGRHSEEKRIRKVDGTGMENVFPAVQDVKLGHYIACLYDEKVWYGIVEEYSEEFDDYTVSFLCPDGSSGATSFTFPSLKDALAVPGHNVLAIMSPPSLKGSSRLQYTFLKTEMKECMKRADLLAV